MIIYNVTIKIDHAVHDEWLEWMRKTHIPEVLATGLFLDCRICKVLKHEPDGASYAFQYFCEDTKTLHQYHVHHAQRLQAEHHNNFKGKFVAFRTLLEVLVTVLFIFFVGIL